VRADASPGAKIVNVVEVDDGAQSIFALASTLIEPYRWFLPVIMR
jgi:hypothetical protein